MKRHLEVLLFSLAFFTVVHAEKPEKRFGLSMSIGKSFVEQMDDVMSIGAGVRCNMSDRCYIGSQLEYMHAQGRFQNLGMNMSLVSLPIEVGYRLTCRNDMLGISPVIGIGINVATRGEIEIGDKKTNMKIGGDTGADFRLGVDVLLWGVEIGGRYHIPINDKQEGFFGEDAYFSVSAGIGLHKMF